MKRCIIFICSLLFPLWACAQQTHSEDHLTVDGEGHFIRADPLNRYLCQSCTQEQLDDYVNNFIEPYYPNFTRYWELKNKHLYLLKIESSGQVEYPLELLFPKYDGSPIAATWFSGFLSYRFNDSPIIQLNREFYEEESVIKLVNGREVARFKINHRERWLSYARKTMDYYYPLAGISPDIPETADAPRVRMLDFLNDAFAVVTNPKKKPSSYSPIIEVDFKVDLESLEITEAHGLLSAYDLLEKIAAETQSVLDVAVSNRSVIYTIRAETLADRESVKTSVAQPAEAEAPAE